MEHNIQQSLFFDIETTGLSADISAITVIGCCDMDGNVTQWFNEDGLSQKQILTDFLAFIQPYNTLITFNGKTFDLPFLTSKIKEFKINASFDRYEHLDLYQILKPYKNLWGLKNFRQKNLEEYLGIQRTDKLSGKKLIKTYQDYLENGEIKNKESLLLHNLKDLIGLHKIYSLMSYPALLDKEFTLSSYFIENDHFVAHLNLDNVGRIGNPDMEPFAVVIRVHEADGDGNLSVAEGVVVRTRDGIEQAEVVETLAGDIAGSLHLTVFGVHCYVLSCHERYFNKKPDHTSEYDRALFSKE